MLAAHADFNLKGEKASITFTSQEERKGEMGICFAWEGGTVSRNTPIDKRLMGNINITVTKQS